LALELGLVVDALASLWITAVSGTRVFVIALDELVLNAYTVCTLVHRRAQVAVCIAGFDVVDALAS
tara:strand:- start:200 stop:397 length:198 start_codon:yes stop_codon:yes gene_type:complete